MLNEVALTTETFQTEMLRYLGTYLLPLNEGEWPILRHHNTQCTLKDAPVCWSEGHEALTMLKIACQVQISKQYFDFKHIIWLLNSPTDTKHSKLNQESRNNSYAGGTRLTWE